MLSVLALLGPNATPIPVEIVGPQDPNAALNFIFTAIAAGTGVVAAFAGLVAALYAYRTFRVETAKPKLDLAVGAVASVLPPMVERGKLQDLEIGLPLVNAGKTAEGVYIDLWILEDPRAPHLHVDAAKNPAWIQGDSESDYHEGRLLTWTRWTRYYRQHIPKDQQIDLEPFTADVPTLDMSAVILWRLRSVDGSTFPSDGTRGRIDYAIRIAPTP